MVNDNELSMAAIQDLIKSSEEAAAGHGRLSRDGDFKAANRKIFESYR